MSDLRELRDLGETVARSVSAADLKSLEMVARSRRRVRRGLVVAGVAASAVAGVLAISLGLVGPSRLAPVSPDRPSQTTLPSPTPSLVLSPVVRNWHASDIVGHPESVMLYSMDADDPTFRLHPVPAADHDGVVKVWHRCATSPATRYVFDCPEVNSGVALEVQADDPGVAPTLVKMRGSWDLPTARYVGAGTFYLSSDFRSDLPVDWVTQGGLLVSAHEDTPVPLPIEGEPVAAGPGIDVVPCAFPRARVCTLDVPGQRLTPVEVPATADQDMWSSETSAGLWGVTWHIGSSGMTSDVIVQTPDGTFNARTPRATTGHIVPLNVPEGLIAIFSFHIDPDFGGGPSGWHNMPILGLLHVSTDRGLTWRTLNVPDGVPGSLDPRLYVSYLPLLPDGWESWPDYVP